MTLPSKAVSRNVLMACLLLIVGATRADDVDGNSPILSQTDDLHGDLVLSRDEYSSGKEEEFDMLVHIDESLNEKFKTILDECQYPDENETDSLENLVNQTDEYVFLRRRWLEFFRNSPHSNHDVFHVNKDRIEIRERQLREAEYILQSLKVLEIWRSNSEIYYMLSPISLKWGRGFDFAEGENISEATAEYVNDFRSSLRNLEEEVKNLEKLRIKGFRINCFNETIPDDYLESAHQIFDRSYEVAPFYNTAVICGKIIEPILLILITVFGLILNFTLIYIFIRHKEIGNAKTFMILNLPVVSLLRIIFELPLYYQQMYFSRYFMIDPSLCNAFRVFFVSLSAFSILGLITRQYISINRSSYESPMTKRSNNILYFVCVLILSILTATISMFFGNTDHATENILNYHIGYLIIFGLLLPFIMAVMNLVISRKLIQESRETNESVMHQQLDKMNRRGSRISIALAIAYLVGCTPEFVRLIMADYLNVYSNEYNAAYHFTDRALSYLFYSSVCMFPVALYIASGSYRRLFKLYMFRCLISKKQISSTDIVQI